MIKKENEVRQLKKHELYDSLKTDYLKFKENKMLKRRQEVSDGLNHVRNFNVMMDKMESNRQEEAKARLGTVNPQLSLTTKNFHNVSQTNR